MSTRRKNVVNEEVVINNNVENKEVAQSVECKIQRIKLINTIDRATGVIQFTGNISVTIDTNVLVQKRVIDDDGAVTYKISNGNTFSMPLSVLLACLHNNCNQVLIQPIVSYYLGKLVEKSTNDIGLELTMLLNGAKATCVYEQKTINANSVVDEEHIKISYSFIDIAFAPKSLEKPVTVFNELFKGMDSITAAQTARKQLRLGDEPEYLI